MNRIKLIAVLLLFASGAIAQDNNSRGYIVEVGKKAPDFTIRYIDGTTKKLNDFKGKVIMLQFTASWCGVCRKEMPHIEADIWLKHKDNPKFVLLGIDYKETKEKTESFAKTMKITYPLILDESGDIFHLYAEKGAGVTRNVIIGKDGKIVFLTRLFNEKEFEQMKQVINKLLE